MHISMSIYSLPLKVLHMKVRVLHLEVETDVEAMAPHCE